MSNQPYKNLPDNCFWSRTHRNKKMSKIDPVIKGGFTLTQETKIATAGSCFAQHISRHLQAQGYNYYVTEEPHPVIFESVARDFGYGVFSARYGNIYTARQLLQLAQRAYGELEPAENVWEADSGYIDPYRPNIQPEPFASMDEFIAAREAHFAAVRKMIETADVFVFTFGLTEAWVSKEDGMVFPLAPGVAGGSFDPERHAFHNFTVQEVVEDFETFVQGMRQANPNVKILMTVSPVPLIATAREDESVISATSYSKSVLRVAAEELRTRIEDCYYFPSYEVITGNFSRGAYYGPDLREIEDAGVTHAMSLFMKHYTDSATQPPKTAKRKENDAFSEKVQTALDIICDEEMIEKANK